MLTFCEVRVKKRVKFKTPRKHSIDATVPGRGRTAVFVLFCFVLSFRFLRTLSTNLMILLRRVLVRDLTGDPPPRPPGYDRKMICENACRLLEPYALVAVTRRRSLMSHIASRGRVPYQRPHRQNIRFAVKHVNSIT